MSRYAILLLLLAGALAACGSPGSPKPEMASLDSEFTLAPASRAAVDRRGIEVQFVSVIEDSRCPADTTCFWAGQAVVRLGVQSRPGGKSQYDVPQGQSVVIGKYRVTVLKVSPEPGPTRKISPDEYRATLKVERS
jgi:hypothetical protein